MNADFPLPGADQVYLDARLVQALYRHAGAGALTAIAVFVHFLAPAHSASALGAQASALLLGALLLVDIVVTVAKAVRAWFATADMLVIRLPRNRRR
ncbi:hypothetical protein AB0B25_30200 [Nocardia sp. NPDC049190]|uniref:hypothetical protein n=1 Tax=Nocardia sp. NPDC049190 TaxID=3155650 RepID=UPI0033F12D2C